VVLCANGAESARLLLMSANAQFPDGLANSSGLVGRNLMFNTYAAVNAIFEHELNEYKSVQVTRIGPNPIVWSMFAPPPERAWGAEFKSLLEAMPRAMIVATHGTSLPLETNRVDLDPDLEDAWGLPALRVTYKDHPDELAMARSCRIAASRSCRRPGHSRSGGDRWRRRPAARTCSAPAAWATIQKPRSWIATIARTTSRTCSSATGRAS
jgi:hypothetical protein